jgi:signal transduction histidine kinase/Tfp pilus assembly protein PilF
LKKKYLLFFAILFLFACNKGKNANTSETSTSDSVSYYLNLNSKSTNELQRKAHIDKAYLLIKSGKNSKKSREDLSNVIYEYYILGDFDKLKETSEVLREKSQLVHDTISLAKSYRYLGGYYKYSKVLDSSFIFYSKAEKIYEKLNDDSNLANILLNKGIVQFKVGDYLGAELSLSRAYNIYKNTTEYNKLYDTLNQLGLVYNELKEFDKAIFYHTKALELVKKVNLTDNQEEAVCYNNLGYLFIKQQKFGEGVKYFELGLKTDSVKVKDPDLYSLLIDNLAYCRLESNNFDGLPGLFYEALKIRDSIKNYTGVVGSNIHLSEYYKKKNNLEYAVSYAKRAIDVAKKAKIPANVVLALQQASLVDTKNASIYSVDYSRISDSLQLAERKSTDRFARIKLETDEIIAEKDVLEDKNRNLLYVFVITFILVALLFVVRAQRARTRELLFKQNQQKANEEIFNLMMSQQSIIDESRNKEKKRMAQDLHDGVLGRMFGLRLNLDSLNSSTDDDAVQKRHELLNELKTIEQDIREISHDLNREKMVLINNFVSIVHNLLEEQKSLHEADVEYQIDTKIDWDKIGNAIKINMYRILQEGLQNINKYASAGNIKVDISGDKENVYLKIEDDGIGFDVNKKSKGIGMQNMISRTHDCQGIIDINSKKGEGTRIIITVPIEVKQLIQEEA